MVNRGIVWTRQDDKTSSTRVVDLHGCVHRFKAHRTDHGFILKREWDGCSDNVIGRFHDIKSCDLVISQIIRESF